MSAHELEERAGRAEVISGEALGALFGALVRRGYRVVGPTVRDGAIVYDELDSPAQLPQGWTDEQAPGRYRLRRREDGARFGYAVGAHSWKPLLFPSSQRLWSVRRQEGKLRFVPEAAAAPRCALVGVRACDLRAIAIQDRVFCQGPQADPTYQSRRDGLFIVAVHCGVAGGTCFCVSMDTGPRADAGFDLALTELLDEGAPRYLVEVGGPRGAEVLAEIPRRDASEEDLDAARRVVERTAATMGRRMDTTDIKGLLYRNLEHPRWDDVAARCLSCTNCTLACPTCFCSTVEDHGDLEGEGAERWRRWDSCFTADHSYVHGGSVRATTRSRYRQWMTHKLATWIDQFGTSGCVGCGRCITWCPVGIDITEEVRAIRESEGGHGAGHP